MSRRLTLEIPEDVFGPLTQRARAEGRTTEEVAADCIADSVAHFNEPRPLAVADMEDEDTNGRKQEITPTRSTGNPLYNIIGIAKGGRVDGAENHDRYLYHEDPL